MLAETVETRLTPLAATRRPCFATVDVFRDAAAVAELWCELERLRACSIYQTRGWAMPWADTLGRTVGVAPLFVLARSSGGRPVFFASLGIVRRGPIRIAEWLGGSDANFNMPLADPEVAWTRAELHRLFGHAARQCGADAPHVFYLVNQPFAFGGQPNPLQLLARWRSPSPAFGGELPLDAETFFAATLSKDTRKKLRKKEAKLATLGPVRHVVARDRATQQRFIDAFLAQKIARFRSLKIRSHLEAPEMRAFIEQSSAPAGRGIELHALVVGDDDATGRVVAIHGGAAHGGQWSGMFIAFDPAEEVARSSPGDLLLMRVIAKACADRLARFDLGVGAARYKSMFCKAQIELFDATVPIGLVGGLGAAALALRQTLKGAIKANPRLYAMARKFRALRG